MIDRTIKFPLTSNSLWNTSLFIRECMRKISNVISNTVTWIWWLLTMGIYRRTFARSFSQRFHFSRHYHRILHEVISAIPQTNLNLPDSFASIFTDPNLHHHRRQFQSVDTGGGRSLSIQDYADAVIILINRHRSDWFPSDDRPCCSWYKRRKGVCRWTSTTIVSLTTPMASPFGWLVVSTTRHYHHQLSSNWLIQIALHAFCINSFWFVLGSIWFCERWWINHYSSRSRHCHLLVGSEWDSGIDVTMSELNIG